MNPIDSTKDFNGEVIKVKDTVATENGECGEVIGIWDDGSIDIHHSNAHQGPVIDSFDIIGHKIHKIDLEEE